MKKKRRISFSDAVQVLLSHINQYLALRLTRVFLQATNENISSSVLNRLIKEVKDYTKQPVSDVTLQVNEENVTDLRAEISGPGWHFLCCGSCCLTWRGSAAETPFHGGVFKIKLVFGPDFPSAPPKGFFITPIFHPNIAKNGEICVNTLKKDWKSDCKLGHILMVCVET